MNYQAFTNDALLMMHHGARGALAVDDELNKLGQERRFRVRETPDWVEHASGLEAEMLRRGMSFDAIRWSEDQAPALQPDALPQAEDADASQKEPTQVGQSESVESVNRLRSRIAAVFKMRSTG